MLYRYEELAGMIDHALLHPTLTESEFLAGCEIAVKYRIASVCVKPCWISAAVEAIGGSTVAVGTVIGFPHGANSSEVKRYETSIACKEGATEVDMVINTGKVLSGDWDYVAQDIRAVVDEGHAHDAIVKVIFETDYLTDDALKITLCKICEDAQADFVKTSTGFGFVRGEDGRFATRGATEHDVKLMRAHCSPAVGVKASGGIRDLDVLIRFKQMGCARVGTSSTVQILDEFLQRTTETDPPTPPTWDVTI